MAVTVLLSPHCCSPVSITEPRTEPCQPAHLGTLLFFLKLCIFLPGYKTERAQTADSPVREERLMGADTSACQLTQFHVESGVLVLLILKPSSFLTENHHLTTKWIFLHIKIFNFIFLIPHSSKFFFFFLVFAHFFTYNHSPFCLSSLSMPTFSG